MEWSKKRGNQGSFLTDQNMTWFLYPKTHKILEKILIYT
jgi:hypothetical protein